MKETNYQRLDPYNLIHLNERRERWQLLKSIKTEPVSKSLLSLLFNHYSQFIRKQDDHFLICRLYRGLPFYNFLLGCSHTITRDVRSIMECTENGKTLIVYLYNSREEMIWKTILN